MRLLENEIKAIKETFHHIFQDGDIYLFGSRVDDHVKGGDIDLFVVPVNRQNLLEKKIDFLVELKQKIGDQKIDLLISKDKTRVIEQEAYNKGIKL